MLVKFVSTVATKYIEAETNGPTFCRRLFQMHFIIRKVLYFDSNFAETCYQRSMNTMLAVVQIKTCYSQQAVVWKNDGLFTDAKSGPGALANSTYQRNHKMRLSKLYELLQSIFYIFHVNCKRATLQQNIPNYDQIQQYVDIVYNMLPYGTRKLALGVCVLSWVRLILHIYHCCGVCNIALYLPVV